MLFEHVDQIKAAGFTGFKTIRELWLDTTGVPPVKGVYLVLYTGVGQPEFVETGTSGPFRGGNPNVPVGKLEKAWVDGTPVLFIGKAGGSWKRHGWMGLPYFSLARRVAPAASPESKAWIICARVSASLSR